MKYLKIYLAEVILAIAFLIISAFFCGSNISSNSNSNISAFNTGWSYVNEDGDTVVMSELPKRIDVGANNTLVLTKTLPRQIKAGTTLLFYTSHQNVKVSINSTQIYYFTHIVRSIGNTPGPTWNFVELTQDYANAVIKVELTSPYDSTSGIIPNFTYGDKITLLNSLFSKNMLSLFLSIVIFVIGLGIVFGCVMLKDKIVNHESLVWLGVFALMLSIWSITETHILPIIMGHAVIFSQLSFISLILMFFPFIRFVRLTYGLKKSKIFDGISLSYLVAFIIILGFQIFEVYDFKESVIVSHILIVFSAIGLIVETIRAILSKEIRNKYKIWANCICALIVTGCIILDLFYYYVKPAADASCFVRIGFLIYIIVLGIISLKDSRDLIAVGEEAMALREIAYVDALTKLHNRASFEKDLEMVKPKDYDDYSMIMFDLNNLKYFNDVHGHSMGDYYIIVCSEIIQDLFSPRGIVYRIGGDEFCAVVTEMSEEEYEFLTNSMEKRIAALNIKYFKVKMEIAHGYAHFDSAIDGTLNDTRVRADQEMYKNKAEQKKAMEN